jgi:hypothetical protein
MLKDASPPVPAVLRRSFPDSKILVAIPAFNEGTTIGSVVLKARQFASQVVVVDDGSTDDTAETAALAGAHVIHHARNLGKGMAYGADGSTPLRKMSRHSFSWMGTTNTIQMTSLVSSSRSWRATRISCWGCDGGNVGHADVSATRQLSARLRDRYGCVTRGTKFGFRLDPDFRWRPSFRA